MKIALVTGEYPPMEGGVGAFSQELGRELAGQGHDIHIITSYRARPQLDREPAPTVRQVFSRLNDRREPLEIAFGRLHPRGRRWTWRDMNMIADLTERYAFDVVNIQYQAAAFNMRSPAVNFLPWRLRQMTTAIVTYHDLRVPYLFPKAGFWRNWVVRQMARQASGVIVTNQTDFEALAGEIHTPLAQIPIGSNISTHHSHHVERQEARDSLGLGKGDLLLGYFGFLNETKGADLLVEALSRLDEKVHLVFIGGRLGSSDSANNRRFQDRLDEAIANRGLQNRVHWTGFLSELRVSVFLNLCDLIVLPYRDGVSLRRGTLMAALAHGRPIVSTLPERPVQELHHGQNIWLVPAGEAAPLAGGIQRLLEDPPLLAQLGNAARETSDRFSWTQIAVDTAAFFQECRAPANKRA